jgi:hypothetical protein
MEGDVVLEGAIMEIKIESSIGQDPSELLD